MQEAAEVHKSRVEGPENKITALEEDGKGVRVKLAKAEVSLGLHQRFCIIYILMIACVVWKVEFFGVAFCGIKSQEGIFISIE